MHSNFIARIMSAAARLILFVLGMVLCSVAGARVNVQSFDSSVVIDKAAIYRQSVQATDSVVAAHPMLNTNRLEARELRHIFYDDTFDFYMILGLVLAFGLMRIANPRYFQYLLRAFRSPSFSNNQLRDQLDTAMVPNMLMNLFFACTGGVYCYYIIKTNLPNLYSVYNPVLIIGVLVLGLGLLYAGKMAILRFSGWAFNVSVLTEHYLYNVLLVNKITAIALLPFIVMMAFMGQELARPLLILSLAVVSLLFINRYIRSWQVLGPFFQYSRFHFFTYLCASELLPIALLAKLIIQGMYY